MQRKTAEIVAVERSVDSIFGLAKDRNCFDVVEQDSFRMISEGNTELLSYIFKRLSYIYHDFYKGPERIGVIEIELF